MPKTQQVLAIDPPEALGFKGPFTEVVTSYLKLKNPTEHKIAFKVKTTAPKRYCVRPNSGVLRQDGEITVSVMLQPFEFDPSEKTKHKFMIQSMIVQAEAEESELWKDVDPEKLMDTKLRVVFDNDPAPSAAAPQAAEAAGPTNDLDVSSVPVQITPQKANVKASGGSDEEYQKLKDENSKLLQEIASLKEESNRFRRLAMADTVSAGSMKTATASEIPSGISLLFQDTTNIVIIFVFIIVAFFFGFLIR